MLTRDDMGGVGKMTKLMTRREGSTMSNILMTKYVNDPLNRAWKGRSLFLSKYDFC